MTGAFDKLSPAVTRRFERRIDVVSVVRGRGCPGGACAHRRTLRRVSQRVRRRRSILGLACLLEALNNCDKPGCDGNYWWRDSEGRPGRSSRIVRRALSRHAETRKGSKDRAAHLRATCKTQLADTLYTNIIGAGPRSILEILGYICDCVPHSVNAPRRAIILRAQSFGGRHTASNILAKERDACSPFAMARSSALHARHKALSLSSRRTLDRRASSDP
jgi:hypothetical protein